jgi:Protein of unknown function (DUF3616)
MANGKLGQSETPPPDRYAFPCRLDIVAGASHVPHSGSSQKNNAGGTTSAASAFLAILTRTDLDRGRLRTKQREQHMMFRSLFVAGAITMVAACGARAENYIGLCEASAGAFIDDSHFAVASDETNTIQIYRRGTAQPIGRGIDLEDFTTFDKSDLEGAARIGDRIYWISSHSFNSDGEDKPKRKLFFATKIVLAGGKPSIEGFGRPVKSLRDPLARIAAVKPSELNIEGLAATPEGGLLIGLRAPLRNRHALVVPLRNPAAVVDRGAPPEFADALRLDLGGLGIRSLEYVGRADLQYLIVAGPVSDSAAGFVLFRWSGPGTQPTKSEALSVSGLRPEVAMAVPGQDLVQLLSDDGDLCSDEDDPPAKRKFRSIDVKP